jgi:hypothetical protein
MNGTGINSGLDHFVSRQNGENVEKVTEKKSCGTEMKHWLRKVLIRLLHSRSHSVASRKLDLESSLMQGIHQNKWVFFFKCNSFYSTEYVHFSSITVFINRISVFSSITDFIRYDFFKHHKNFYAWKMHVFCYIKSVMLEKTLILLYKKHLFCLKWSISLYWIVCGTPIFRAVPPYALEC